MVSTRTATSTWPFGRATQSIASRQRPTRSITSPAPASRASPATAGRLARPKLGGPKGLAYRGGTLYVADTENHVIRTIDIRSGIINTVIGTGQRGDGPETDPLQCRMSRPHGLTVDAAGVLYVTDSEAHRIRVLK